MFHIASSKGPPPIPDHLSAEARDFILLCFDRSRTAVPCLASLIVMTPMGCMKKQEARRRETSACLNNHIQACWQSQKSGEQPPWPFVRFTTGLKLKTKGAHCISSAPKAESGLAVQGALKSTQCNATASAPIPRGCRQCQAQLRGAPATPAALQLSHQGEEHSRKFAFCTVLLASV